MNTVWTFGDSLTDGFRSDNIWAKKYVEWKGYIPLTYGEIISKKLNYNLINLGKGGSDNNTIFESFIKNIDNIKDGDIVIIGWSDIGRFRLATKNNEWCSFVPNFDYNMKNMENISNQTIMEVCVNRLSDIYIDELNHFIKIMKYSLPNNIIYNWSPFLNIRNSVANLENIIAPSGINIETNGLVNDYHYGQSAHLNLAMYFYKKIKSIK